MSDIASVTIQPNISVGVAPGTINLILGQSQQFTANVSNSSNQSVTWSIAGANCSGAGCGVITTGGNYTAPGSIPAPNPFVSVTATSSADPSVSGVATVKITPVPTPTVQISGPTPAGPIALNSQYTYTAIVSLDPQNQGVVWTLVCTADGEGKPDCANNADSDGDKDNFTLDKITPNSVELVTAPIIMNITNFGESYTLSLTATSVAVGSNGNHGTNTVIIVVPHP
jgi:hypothetical protein